ncbi:ATP-binding protein [Pedobacter caeni]|uniref:histidine kinase n=1 Tax=Pedobacter caeni TaxID=288992 RepID=A0A1M5JWQ3_9SPHI|nr:ATP-binding protein [Pedobacter caeni]SHG44976.1 PAS domain S-box-containing protein [Pedobacter caeni]
MHSTPEISSQTPHQTYFDGGGEMGALTRDYDWSKTVLGPPEQWSQSLLTTIGIMLKSRFPMFLWWGTELIQFYNDAYRPSLGNEGKHPKALGQQGEECWPEIWPVIKPLIDQVLSGGESTWSEDQLIPIYRNNRLEDVYWTFSYSKVNDAPGKPGGVLVICSETTEKVNTMRKIENTISELAESESRLRFMLADAPVAIALFTGRALIIEAANKKVLEVWGKGEEVIGKPLHIAVPELKDQPFFQILDDVFTTGQSFHGNEVKAMLELNHKLEEVYSNFVYQPLKNVNGETTGIVLVANVITEQVIARKKVEQAEEMLRLSIEAANVGTWHMDVDTRKFSPSSRMKELYGFDPEEEVSYDDITNQIPEEYRNKVRLAVEQAIASGESYSIEHPVTGYHDQTSRWVRALGKLYPDTAGHPAHFSGLTLDITEQKQDEMRKNDFIGMVSHELKTPLTSLNGYLQLLIARMKKSEDTFTTGSLEKAHAQVKKMSTMINGFLNISRLESGKIHLDMETFDLDQLIREIIEETKPTLQHHSLTLSPCHPVSIHADREKIGSVISNLLSNAIKYSPKGKKIEVNCQIKGEIAEVSVKDEGMGIKPLALEKLFERFYRVETKHTQNISGFGIGLYLCSEILLHHGGKIWVKSEIGVGSTFYFSLPLAP